MYRPTQSILQNSPLQLLIGSHKVQKEFEAGWDCRPHSPEGELCPQCTGRICLWAVSRKDAHLWYSNICMSTWQAKTRDPSPLLPKEVAQYPSSREKEEAEQGQLERWGHSIGPAAHPTLAVCTTQQVGISTPGSQISAAALPTPSLPGVVV